MLVIHIDNMFDTTPLSKVYQGIDCKILYNPTSRNEAIDALKEENEMVVFLGHGTPEGLIPPNWRSYIFDRSMASLLLGKTCVGIWCDACDFAEKYSLKGFFTDMFISNQNEANMFGFDASNADVLAQVRLFCDSVNRLLREKKPMSSWIDSIKAEGHLEKDFVRYNYDRLKILV